MRNKKFISAFVLGTFLILSSSQVEAQLKNHRLFKVDPAGALFHELRCMVEHRISQSDFFWVVSPYGYHENNLRHSDFSFGQKYYGLGCRAAIRKYFAWKRIQNQSPQGLFFQPMIGYKLMFVSNLGTGGEIASRAVVQQPSVGFTGGYQWLYGRKKNLAYGFTLGLEYFAFFPHNNAISYDDTRENWYKFPISFKPSFLNGLRLYLGIELGFAFRQLDLHW